MASAPSKHKKFIDDYLAMDDTKLDYGHLENAEDDKVHKAYELHHTKKAAEGSMGLEAHMKGELHNVVKEFMGDKINFQHIDNAREREKEATKFADEMMKFSLERFYQHTGSSKADAEKRANEVMSDSRLAKTWGTRLWGEMGRDGFIASLAETEGNIRDFLVNDDLYKQLYQSVVIETDPHAVRKEKLYDEVSKKHRHDGVDKYFMKQLKASIGEDDSGKFEVYATASRRALMDLAMGLKRGDILSKPMINQYERMHKTKLFSKMHEKYKKKD